MISIVENPVRRLITASASAIVLHAGVFGVAEWRLSQAAEHTTPPARELSVVVRLNPTDSQAAAPERPKVDNSDEIPHNSPSIPEETAPDSSTHRREEDALMSAETKPQETGATEMSIQPRVTDVQDIASELSSDTTDRQQIPAALRRSVDSYRRSQPTDPSPTFTPERYTAPRYPEAARRRGLTGTVVVQATISPRGRVIGVDIVGSSGVDSLDSAAVRAVRSWRFARGGQDRHSLHRIRFDLEDAP